MEAWQRNSAGKTKQTNKNKNINLSWPRKLTLLIKSEKLSPTSCFISSTSEASACGNFKAITTFWYQVKFKGICRSNKLSTERSSLMNAPTQFLNLVEILSRWIPELSLLTAVGCRPWNIKAERSWISYTVQIDFRSTRQPCELLSVIMVWW